MLDPQNDIATGRLALPRRNAAAPIEAVRASKSGQPAVQLRDGWRVAIRRMSW